MKNYVEKGDAFNYKVTGAAVKSGDLVCVNGEDMMGVAVTDGEIGDTVALSMTGVYSLKKDGKAITLGSHVYRNNTTGLVTADTTAGGFVGLAWSAAAAGDSTVNVKLAVSI